MKNFSRFAVILGAATALVLASRAEAAIVVSNDPALDLNSFLVVGKQVADFILGIVGSLTLLMFIYGGFLWIMSGGSSDRVKKGKDIIIGSVVGLLIVFASYTIISYFTNEVLQAKNVKDSSKPLFTGQSPTSNPPSSNTDTACKQQGGVCEANCTGGRVPQSYAGCTAPKGTCCVPKANTACAYSCQEVQCATGYVPEPGICAPNDIGLPRVCCKSE